MYDKQACHLGPRSFGSMVLAAGLLACSCTNLRDGQQQVIYVPTENGVEAQRVSVGPPPANDDQPDGPTAVDPEAERREVRAALLTSSDHLEYLGQVSEPLFIVKDRLQASIGSKRADDYDTGNSICHIWARHVQQFIAAGDLTYCRDYLIESESFRGAHWETPGVAFHSLTYAFENLRERCDDIGGWPLPCEGPPLQDSGPGLLKSPLCAVVVAQLFRAPDGRRFALIEGTDPEVYGSRREIGILSNPERSQQAFSRDFSGLNTRESCANFFEGEVP